MSDIKQREEKMKEKIKKIGWRDFIKYCGSLQTFVFHKNNGMISRYPQTDRIGGIRKTMDFEANRDNLTKSGLDYDFNKSFFQNYQDLMKHTTFPAMFSYGNNENSEYTDGAHTSKNAYLTFLTTFGSENVLYSFSVKSHCTNVLNSIMIIEGNQNIYMSFSVIRSYNIFFSRYIEDCSDIWFSTNMVGCRECIFCNDLQNQQFCIQNKSYPKEEYLHKKNELLQQKEKFTSRYISLCNVPGKNVQTTNCSGSSLFNCIDVENGYVCFNLNRGKNAIGVQSEQPNEDMYDAFLCGRSHDFYGVTNSGAYSDNIYIGLGHNNVSHAYYSIFLDSCSYCIACIGLKNKQFCILNKEYTKEQRYELADKIFAQMEKDGTLGEFFPGSTNPLYFNDTAAYMMDDTFTKEEVTKEGYLRRDEEIKVDIPSNAEIVETKDLNNYQGLNEKGEWKIDKEILKKVIKDEQGNYYRIVPMELEFLQKYGLPLPELHWLDRIKLGFKFK